MTLKELHIEISNALHDYHAGYITILALDTVIHETIKTTYKAGYLDGKFDAEVACITRELELELGIDDQNDTH